MKVCDIIYSNLPWLFLGVSDVSRVRWRWITIQVEMPRTASNMHQCLQATTFGMYQIHDT